MPDRYGPNIQAARWIRFFRYHRKGSVLPPSSIPADFFSLKTHSRLFLPLHAWAIQFHLGYEFPRLKSFVIGLSNPMTEMFSISSQPTCEQLSKGLSTRCQRVFSALYWSWSPVLTFRCDRVRLAFAPAARVHVAHARLNAAKSLSNSV